MFGSSANQSSAQRPSREISDETRRKLEQALPESTQNNPRKRPRLSSTHSNTMTELNYDNPKESHDAGKTRRMRPEELKEGLPKQWVPQGMEIYRAFVPVGTTLPAVLKLTTGLERSSWNFVSKHLKQNQLFWRSAGEVAIDATEWKNTFIDFQKSLPFEYPLYDDRGEKLENGTKEWQEKLSRILPFHLENVAFLRHCGAHRKWVPGNRHLTLDIYTLVSRCLPFAIMIRDVQLELKIRRTMTMLRKAGLDIRDGFATIGELDEKMIKKAKARIRREVAERVKEEIEEIFFEEGRGLIEIDTEDEC